jgi:hypothetical protein
MLSYNDAVLFRSTILTTTEISANKYYKYSCVPTTTSISLNQFMFGHVLTHAAVAANNSARRAFVSNPTLPANKVVKVAINPKRQSGECTLYSMTIAPMSNKAARKVLNHAMKELMARSEA